jgi:prepilin-type N-terminal cleavage/methylation domain-containing protein
MNAFISPQKSGFTLLEMMITLAIFVLLVAAVFTLMTGTLESANTLTDDQNRKDESGALNAYLKKRLSELPVDSTIVSYQRGDGEGLVQNGVLFGTSYFATAFDAGIQPNGYYTLRIATFSTGASSATDGPAVDARTSLLQLVTTNDPTLVWISLMTDIKTIDWKFLDFNQTEWVELWSSGTKPNLAEFSMQPAGDLQTTTMDFWLPKIDRVTLGAQQGGGTSGGGGATQLRPQRTQPPQTVPTH